METPPVLEETVNVSEQPVGIPLTPGICLFHLFFAVMWLLSIVVNSLVGITTNDKGLIVWNLVASIITIPNVWVKWKQYQRVNGGAVVYARHPKIRLPAAVSVIVFGVLTLLAIAATTSSVVFLQMPWLRYDIFRDDLLTVLAVLVVANVFLWGYVAYCWYRLSLESQWNKPPEILIEPTEGVWPPPPVQRS